MKHANPCGIALGADLAEAHRKAHACDPVSAFGGVIAANGTVTEAMAAQVAEIFTEVIIAPDFEPGRAGDPDREEEPAAAALRAPPALPRRRRARLAPGQRRPADADAPTPAPSRATTRRTGSSPAGQPADAGLLADLEFAWRACRGVKSNAILLAAGQASVGIGMGQVNRVDSCRLAVTRAGERAAGSVAASDAYFPFADGFQILAEAGVRAVAEPGGSVRDDEVDRGGAGRRGRAVLHRRPALLPLTGRGRSPPSLAAAKSRLRLLEHPAVAVRVGERHPPAPRRLGDRVLVENNAALGQVGQVCSMSAQPSTVPGSEPGAMESNQVTSVIGGATAGRPEHHPAHGRRRRTRCRSRR